MRLVDERWEWEGERMQVVVEDKQKSTQNKRI